MAKTKSTTNTMLSTIINVAVDPAKSKYDIMDTLRQLIDNNKGLYDAFGQNISDDDMNDIRSSSEADTKDQDVEYVKQEDKILVNPVEKQKKLVAMYVKEANKEEARFITDFYHRWQKYRISIQNQIRSINQGKDKSTSFEMEFLQYILKQIITIEDSVKACLSDYSDRMPMAKYAKSIKGIGPVFASTLSAYLEIPDKDKLPASDQVFTVGHWWSYAGLNDNNRPWLGGDEAKKMVEDSITENNGAINDDTVYILCAKTMWKYDHYYKFCCDKKTGKFKGFTKDKLISATKMIPYNSNLKKTMYLIGQSIIKVQNKPDSLYGKLYKERLEYEIKRNEEGYNKPYCDKKLSERKYDKSTETYKCYSNGKISKGQIIMRAQRHTTKIILSHIFEFEYLNKYHEPAPVPYIFLHAGHKDYIEPEVPYDIFDKKD